MALEVGTFLRRDEIVSPVGAGGMGEIDKAEILADLEKDPLVND